MVRGTRTVLQEEDMLHFDHFNKSTLHSGVDPQQIQ